MLDNTAPVLFESTDNSAVQNDPANEDWLAVVRAIDGEEFEVLARRYYFALTHLRKHARRPPLPGKTNIVAEDEKQARQGMLLILQSRKTRCSDGADEGAPGVFVDVGPDVDVLDLPDVLKDFSLRPGPLRQILAGPGRPPCDALCLMRAFLAAPLLCGGDAPTSVHRLLHSNPSFARCCGFLGRQVLTQDGEMTSRRLPSLSMCEEFSEVMTRYGLWHLARLQQVQHNLDTGVVEVEGALAFDTTHIVANSHCDGVLPQDTKIEDGKKPKQRKVPRMTKNCDCGKENRCGHPWSPTDEGAAVVVKGPTRIYWAHKASVVNFAHSEVPFDARVLNYAAEHDGKTLMPHLKILQHDFPTVVEKLRLVLADDSYRDNEDAVSRFTQEQARLIVPVHGKKARTGLAECFEGIDRFTPAGVPVCDAGHRFEMRGRDILNERFIWTAPHGEDGRAVCETCPLAQNCLSRGTRRHIRVDRNDQPQIDWDHPQHGARERARYGRRTGVERAIKRLKADLHGDKLTHRDAHRVQAHLDRKLLVLHLLLASTA